MIFMTDAGSEEPNDTKHILDDIVWQGLDQAVCDQVLMSLAARYHHLLWFPIDEMILEQTSTADYLYDE